jgi:hypothetical protein
VKVKGIQAVTKELEKKAKQIENKIVAQVFDSGQEIIANAESNKPNYSWGNITISKGQSDKFTFVVEATDFGSPAMAAYWEFGTGKNFLENMSGYTREQINLAKKFYVDGKGTIKAHPYLFPAYYTERKNFIKEVKKIIKNI